MLYKIKDYDDPNSLLENRQPMKINDPTHLIIDDIVYHDCKIVSVDIDILQKAINGEIELYTVPLKPEYLTKKFEYCAGSITNFLNDPTIFNDSDMFSKDIKFSWCPPQNFGTNFTSTVRFSLTYGTYYWLLEVATIYDKLTVNYISFVNELQHFLRSINFDEINPEIVKFEWIKNE